MPSGSRCYVRILAIDTATEGCSAAVLVEDSVTSRGVEMERGHAERILLMVDELIAEAGISLSQLDAIAFGRGPGSFTGVRLAASVTQGLAFGAGLPVVPVSDLRAVAQRLRGSGPVTRVLVCNDARMREVYWGCFEVAADGLMQSVGEEHVGPPGSVWLPSDWQAVQGAGRGFAAYDELRATLATRLTSVDDRLLPHAADIAVLAAGEARANRLQTAEQALPVYLRDDVARPPSRTE